MALSKKQAEVVELMRGGWELVLSVQFRGGSWLEKSSMQYRTVSSSTLKALLRKGVIIAAKREYPLVWYRLTDGRLNTHPKDANADMRRQQRIDAGLTLRQAAKLLGIYPVDLSSIERGDMQPSADLLERMAKMYGVGT